MIVWRKTAALKRSKRSGGREARDAAVEFDEVSMTSIQVRAPIDAADIVAARRKGSSV